MSIEQMLKLPGFLKGMPPLTIASLERDSFSWVRLRNSRKEPEVVEKGAIDLDPEWFDWGLTGSPVVNRSALLERLGPSLHEINKFGPDIGLLVPDTCFRLPLVALEVLPKSKSEWPALFQFKLRRMIPYRIQDARMSWVKTKTSQSAGGQFLVGLIHESVASPLETLFSEGGLKVGVLAPLGLEWTLWALEKIKEPTLLVHRSGISLLLTFGRKGFPEVVRIRDFPEGEGADDDAFSSWLHKEIEATETYLTEHLKFDGVLSVFRGGQEFEGIDVPGQQINLFRDVPTWQENLLASAHGRWP